MAARCLAIASAASEDPWTEARSDLLGPEDLRTLVLHVFLKLSVVPQGCLTSLLGEHLLLFLRSNPSTSAAAVKKTLCTAPYRTTGELAHPQPPNEADDVIHSNLPPHVYRNVYFLLPAINT